MQRIATATKVDDLFGPGKAGFRDGDLVGGFAPTDFNAAWPNFVQEEILSVIESAGVVAGPAMTQMRQALRRMFGGNVKQITHVGSPHALTADDAGLVLINAAGGNVVVNLPAANILAGLPFRIRRIDTTSANTVTVNRSGADTIDEGGTSFTIAPKGTQIIESNGVTAWSTSSGLVLATPAEAQGFTANKLITAATLAAAFQGSNQGNNFQRLPGGFLLQWGTIAATCSTTVTQSNGTLPVTFPVAGLGCIGTREVNLSTNNAITYAEIFNVVNASTVAVTHVTNGSPIGMSWKYWAWGR